MSLVLKKDTLYRHKKTKTYIMPLEDRKVDAEIFIQFDEVENKQIEL